MITVYAKYESLNCVLARLGISSETRGNGRKAHFRDGVLLFEGRAHQCWDWLLDSGHICLSDETRDDWTAMECLLTAVCCKKVSR